MIRHMLSTRLLGATASMVVRRPFWVIGAYLIGSAAALLLTVTRLELKTDQNDLVSSDLPYNKRYLEFLDDFGDLEFLYVVIQVDGKPELAMKVADAVAEEVSKLEDYVQDVHHRVHPKSFGDSVFLLMPKDDLEKMAEKTRENADLLARLADVDSFAAMFRLLPELFDATKAQEDPEKAEWGFNFLDMTLTSISQAARGEQPPPLEQSIESIALGPDTDPESTGYLFTGDLALVEIMPTKNYETLEVIQEPLARIREALDTVREQFPGVKLGLTGRPALQADEMETTNQDMIRATIGALITVLILFIVFFRRLRRPLLATVTLSVGILLTFGVVTVSIGYLTILSIVFAVMLVGLGIDSGVHLLSRYQEELGRSGDIESSMHRTLVSTGLAIWTGGITTSAAFFSTCFVSFKGLAELGFVAGTGLIICMVSMLSLLPALVIVTDRFTQRWRGLSPPHLIRVPFLEHTARYPRRTLLLLALLTFGGTFAFRGIPYNYNLLDLQAQGLESVEYERILTQKSGHSTWYAAFVVDSLEAIDRIQEALKPAQKLGIVGEVESIRRFLQKDEKERIELLEPVADVISRLKIPRPQACVDPEALTASLEGFLRILDEFQALAATRGSEEDIEAVQALDGLITKAEDILDLLEGDPTWASACLGAYQVRWLREMEDFMETLHRLLRPPPITIDKIPPAVRRHYVSEDGERFLVHAFAKKDVWEEQNMVEFIETVRRVDSEVTGVPIQVHESASLMKEGFLRAALYSLILVFILVLMDLLSLRYALLTLVPLGAGLLWTLEVMPLLGLDFNLANFFVLPILVGYGVSGGVHVVHRFREARSVRELGETVSSAVTLSCLTTMAGFGWLAIAQHRGVASLGMTTTLGCGMVLVASVVLLPCILAVVFPPSSGTKDASEAGGSSS